MQESIEDIRAELEERLRFETLLAEISARFVNLPSDHMDSEIEEAQRLICEALDIDLVKKKWTLLLSGFFSKASFPQILLG